MEATREVLAGIAAEHWVEKPLKNFFNQPIAHTFGGAKDRLIKVDYDTFDRDGGDLRLDVKASADYPNCLVEINHPAFNPRNMQAGQRAFVFPFRDREEIVVVRSKSWFHDILESRARKLVYDKRSYYVVEPDFIFRTFHSPDDVYVIPTTESFGSFFDREFPGNPLEGMSEEEIKRYAEETVRHLCINDDIPA